MSQRSDSGEGSAQTTKNGDLVRVALDPETKSSSAAASLASERSGVRNDGVDVEKAFPGRPLTAFLNTKGCIRANEFFDVLKENGVDLQEISCIQRQLSSEIVITFRTEALKEAFIQRNVLAVRGQPFAIQDIDCPLTYLQIFDAPYELPDSAIVEKLSHYCEVVHQCRGYFTAPGFQHIHDGVRQFRVRVKHPIPSFLRFRKIQIHLRYIGQQKTCRPCNSPDHLANACNAVVCFNCDDIGHLANNCRDPVFCNLCKSVDHKAKNCHIRGRRESCMRIKRTNWN